MESGQRVINPYVWRRLWTTDVDDGSSLGDDSFTTLTAWKSHFPLEICLEEVILLLWVYILQNVSLHLIVRGGPNSDLDNAEPCASRTKDFPEVPPEYSVEERTSNHSMLLSTRIPGSSSASSVTLTVWTSSMVPIKDSHLMTTHDDLPIAWACPGNIM